MHLIKKIGSVEFKPQQINSKNIYGNKSCILQRWFKKISCSEVEVTYSEKDQRGFYIKKVIGDGNCFFRAVSLDLTGKEPPLFFLMLCTCK